jgi:hypothetical protein
MGGVEVTDRLAVVVGGGVAELGAENVSEVLLVLLLVGFV